jgi:hypothetical protein
MRNSRRILASLAVVSGLLAGLAPSPAAALDLPEVQQWMHWVGLAAPHDTTWVRAFGTGGTTMWAGTEGDGVYCSTNAGITWQNCGGGLPASTSVRQINAGVTSAMIATDSGIFKTTGSLLSWSTWAPVGQGTGSDKLNEAVQTILDTSVGPVVNNGLLAGYVGGLAHSLDGGNTWSDSGSGLPSGVTVWSLNSYTWLPNLIFAATSQGAYTSVDFGAHWASVSLGLPTNTNIMKIVSDPQTPTTWYAATSGGGVYRSTTSGLLWEAVNEGLSSGGTHIRALLPVPVAANYSDIYIGTDDGVWSSINKGDSWQKISDDGLAGHNAIWALSTSTSSVPVSPVLVAGAQGYGVNYRVFEPPINTGRPVITNTTNPGSAPHVGEQLSTTDGTWDGTKTMTFSYQWWRCTGVSGGLGTSCSKIDKATDSSYTVDDTDYNDYLKVNVVAKNAVSLPAVISSMDSLASARVLANPGSLPGASIYNNPSITIAPIAHAGTPFPGDQLTAAHNTVTPAGTSYAYEWFGCDASNLNCVSRGAPQTGAYTIVAGDVDGTVGVRTYATNSFGTAVSGMSYFGSTVLPLQVTQTSAPKVLGVPWVGYTMTAAMGSYSGTVANTFPTWQACDAAFAVNVDGGSHCSTLANTWQYTPNALQKGYYLRIKVEVDVNGWYQAPATLVTYSATTTAKVTTPSAVVKNTKAPTVSGTPLVGKTLTINVGTWTGSPTYKYAWYRCNSAGSACVRIPKATAKTYKLVGADTARRIRGFVTASNAVPSKVAKLTSALALTKGKPYYATGGKVNGTRAVGQTLTAVKGTWQAYPSATFTYQWLRNGSAISGATKSTYKLTSKDKAHTITVKVTGKNSLGSLAKIFSAGLIP